MLEKKSGDNQVLLPDETATLEIGVAAEAAAETIVRFSTASAGVSFEPADLTLTPGASGQVTVTLPRSDRRHTIEATVTLAEDKTEKVVYQLRTVDPDVTTVSALVELARDLGNMGAYTDDTYGRRLGEDLRAIQHALSIAGEKLTARVDAVPDERTRSLLAARINALLESGER